MRPVNTDSVPRTFRYRIENTSLEKGKRADVIELDERLAVIQVFIGGKKHDVHWCPELRSSLELGVAVPNRIAMFRMVFGKRET